MEPSSYQYHPIFTGYHLSTGELTLTWIGLVAAFGARQASKMCTSALVWYRHLALFDLPRITLVLTHKPSSPPEVVLY
jgi:hypothetical protein